MTLKELKYIIKDMVRRKIYEYCNHSTILNMNPIVEMARLNKREIGNVPFPYNKFDIRIWSNDHNPPHFHVISEGWDISFLIENGEEYRVNTHSNDSKIYSYIIKNIKPWLRMKNFKHPYMTNQEYAMEVWEDENEINNI